MHGGKRARKEKIQERIINVNIGSQNTVTYSNQLLHTKMMFRTTVTFALLATASGYLNSLGGGAKSGNKGKFAPVPETSGFSISPPAPAPAAGGFSLSPPAAAPAAYNSAPAAPKKAFSLFPDDAPTPIANSSGGAAAPKAAFSLGGPSPAAAAPQAAFSLGGPSPAAAAPKPAFSLGGPSPAAAAPKPTFSLGGGGAAPAPKAGKGKAKSFSGSYLDTL
jgi:hypothetical protein